jgi:flagellar assembly protein FliH
MAAAEKFWFGRDFTREAPTPAPAPHAEPEPEPEAEQPPAPIYSAEELEAARAAGRETGYRDGHAAGHAEATAAADAAQTQALERIADGLAQIGRGLDVETERRDGEALEAAVQLMQRLFPALTRRHGQGEIESVLANALERLRDEPRVVVRIADQHLDPLQERIEAIKARVGFEGRIVLFADEALAPGDARIEWADGGAERDGERLWADVQRAVERALVPPVSPAEPDGADAAPDTERTAATAERPAADDEMPARGSAAPGRA